MKWIFGLLLIVNVVFFAIMQWGGSLTVEANNPPIQAALNADKIKIVSMVAPASSVSGVAATALAASSSVSTASSSVAAIPASSVPAIVPPPEKLSCLEWGEFSAADLPRVDKALSAIKLLDKSKQRTVEYTSGYWVYIAPLKSTALVKKKVTQLKKLEIEDYFVMQEPGPWKNAISLGMFKTEEAAKKYLVELREQGVKSAKVGARASKLKYTVYILNRLDSAAASQVASLPQDFPDSEIKQVPCN